MAIASELDVLQQALKCHQMGEFYQAIELYQQALLEKNDPLVSNNLASAQLALADNEAALVTLTTALAEHPECAELTLTFSLYKASGGELDKAIELALSAIEKAPGRAEFHYNLANFYYQSGDLTAAVKAYQQTLLLNEQFVEAHFNLGTLYCTQGLIEQAIMAFKQTVQMSPQFLPGLMQLAKLYSDEGKYGEAKSYYQKALVIEPNNLGIINALGMIFHVSGELELARQYYKKALDISADDEESNILMANCLRDSNDSAAEQFYQKVLKVNPLNAIAKDNLNRLSKSKIAAWHFNMLADEARNSAFDRALAKHVNKGDLVLDIGTGSGLLAMMAKRAGAEQVVACEMVADLAQVARQVVADNNMDDAITICNHKSTNLKVGVDLPRKADVLVSEILDVGLLGEGVLPTFRHAWANLLNPDAVAIPKAATVEACLIQCDQLKQVNPVSNISGFDLSAFNTFRAKGDYIATQLVETPHQLLSNNFVVQNFDFTNLPANASVEQPNETHLTVPVTQDGELHAIAFWFQLHLDDEITLSSGPQGEMVHWGQAVYFFEQPKMIRQGELVQLKALQSEAFLEFQLLDCEL